MSTTTTTLPDCDCLNYCGDDPAVRNHQAQPCKNRLDWEAKKARVAKQMAIDPRWADIDFDKVNAELRDLRAQVGRLQAHIDSTQPVVANAQGYVEPQAQDGQGLKQFLSAAKDAGITHWSDDLTDRLVAISAAVADSDDRKAQSLLRETLRLLAELRGMAA